VDKLYYWGTEILLPAVISDLAMENK